MDRLRVQVDKGTEELEPNPEIVPIVVQWQIQHIRIALHHQ